MANQPKLFEVLRKQPHVMHRADAFWPLPDTYIGLEIEVEGKERIRIRDNGNIDTRWQIVEDHSLRGGEEWIFSQPQLGVSLREAIDWFFDNVSGYTTSTRTSTHIHINMMAEDTDGDTLRNVLGLYVAAEDLFFKEAGENRKWSGYCAPLSEAPQEMLGAMVSVPFDGVRLAKQAGIKRASADRYYALNLLSIQKHGTLEFRHFPCTNKKEDVIRWIKMVMYLKKGAMLMQQDGIDVFAAMDNADKVPAILNKYMPEIADDVMRACDIYKIASKINAIFTYSNTGTAGMRYDCSKPGLLRKWLEAKGKALATPMSEEEEDALILEEQEQNRRAHYDAGAGAGYERMVRVLADTINLNVKNRQVPKFIGRSSRILNGIDMLDPAIRRIMLRAYPEDEIALRNSFPYRFQTKKKKMLPKALNLPAQGEENEAAPALYRAVLPPEPMNEHRRDAVDIAVPQQANLANGLRQPRQYRVPGEFPRINQDRFAVIDRTVHEDIVWEDMLRQRPIQPVAEDVADRDPGRIEAATDLYVYRQGL